MVRTAVFGGTFNPLHNGHIAIARSVIDSNLADELWLMVTPQNPWKRNLTLMDDDFRLTMARMAVRNLDRIEASDFEFSLSKPSFTSNTLRKLNASYPLREFSLVIGADNWAKFGNWCDSDYIQQNHQIIVYPRSGYPLPESSTANVHILDCPTIDISSTQIRNMLKQGLPVDGLVPPDVAALLGLYETYGIG
ncbi:MAG: nicotinate (nicotinamide) nucleotide adenylyltransferase [Bacteroidaceae bacterium]|nr:nicotinate (nicotinamide) nucleotide adenylyltransferase [Bacteroidaceae bacterium]